MKVSLVVASGAHEGRVIPLAGPQFLIGRDQQCNLRPASPAISKLHCAVLIHNGKVHIKDFGSTNGTLVNGEIIQNAEVVVEDGAALQVGPLDFTVRVQKTAAKADGTTASPGGDTPNSSGFQPLRGSTSASSVARPSVDGVSRSLPRQTR